MSDPKPGRTRLQPPPLPVQTPEQKELASKMEALARQHDARVPEPPRIQNIEQGRRTLKVTWGEENYHPVAYNGFKVGGLELVVDVAPNQTIEEAYELAYGRLQKIAERQFESKLEGFISRLRSAGQAVKVSSASSKG